MVGDAWQDAESDPVIQELRFVRYTPRVATDGELEATYLAAHPNEADASALAVELPPRSVGAHLTEEVESWLGAAAAFDTRDVVVTLVHTPPLVLPTADSTLAELDPVLYLSQQEARTLALEDYKTTVFGSQVEVVRTVEDGGTVGRRYWLVNGFEAMVTPEVVEALAADPTVRRIELSGLSQPDAVGNQTAEIRDATQTDEFIAAGITGETPSGRSSVADMYVAVIDERIDINHPAWRDGVNASPSRLVGAWQECCAGSRIPDNVGMGAGDTTPMDSRWGAGRLRMRKFDNGGMDGPWRMRWANLVLRDTAVFDLTANPNGSGGNQVRRGLVPGDAVVARAEPDSVRCARGSHVPSDRRHNHVHLPGQHARQSAPMARRRGPEQGVDGAGDRYEHHAEHPDERPLQPDATNGVRGDVLGGPGSGRRRRSAGGHSVNSETESRPREGPMARRCGLGLLFGCGGGCVDVDGDAVPFTVLASAKLSNVQVPDDAGFGVLVVSLYSDQGALDSAMEEAIGDPPPAVDFATTQVVLAYVEIAPCIGPDLVVQRLVAPTSTLELTAQLVYPPICDDLLSRPYVLIGVEAAGYIDVVGELLPDAYL